MAVGSKRPRSTSPQSSREDNGKVAGAEVDGKGGDSGGGGPSSNVGGEGGEGRRAGHGEEGRCGTGKEGKAGEGQAVETGGDDDKSKEKFKQERTKEGEETLAVPKPSTTSAGSEGGGKDSGAGSSGSSRTACDKRDATAAGNAAGKDSVASPQSSANVPRNSPAAAAAAAAAGKPGPINEDSDHGKAVHGGGYDSVESRLVEAEKRRGAGGESGGDSPAKTLAGEGRGGDRSRSRSTSAERRPLPPKKDIQRRDSPPVGGDA